MDDLYALEGGSSATTWQRKHNRPKAREAALKTRRALRADPPGFSRCLSSPQNCQAATANGHQDDARQRLRVPVSFRDAIEKGLASLSW